MLFAVDVGLEPRMNPFVLANTLPQGLKPTRTNKTQKLFTWRIAEPVERKAILWNTRSLCLRLTPNATEPANDVAT